MKFGEINRTIRLGIIGLGGRGYGQTETLLDMPDVEIAAVCDVYPDRAAAGVKLVKQRRGTECFSTTDYRQVNRFFRVRRSSDYDQLGNPYPHRHRRHALRQGRGHGGRACVVC